MGMDWIYVEDEEQIEFTLMMSTPVFHIKHRTRSLRLLPPHKRAIFVDKHDTAQWASLNYGEPSLSP